MGACSAPPLSLASCVARGRRSVSAKHYCSERNLLCAGTGKGSRRARLRSRDAAASTTPRAVDGAATDLAPVQITWQIAVGAIAGIAPFVVAGIELGKRIVAQKRCGVCGGSGLVLKSDYYVRCPSCGGFLPWQSWKRFFTG